MYIYEIGSLSHHFNNGQFHLATEWRETLDNWTKDNGIYTFNPAITFLAEKKFTLDEFMCVAQNDYYINKSSIAVADLNCIDFSPGSQYELTTFKWQKKPVIAFGEKHWSPHINSCISQYCKDVNEVIDILTCMFNQNIRI